MTLHQRPIAAVFTPAEREELIHVLDMLGAADDGERANAAQIATNILAAHGLTWIATIEAAPSGGATAPGFWAGADDPQSWRAEAEAYLAKPRKLNNWEKRFLSDILASRWPLSTRQREILPKIGRKALGGSVRDGEAYPFPN